jgi:hypothetical protein
MTTRLSYPLLYPLLFRHRNLLKKYRCSAVSPWLHFTTTLCRTPTRLPQRRHARPHPALLCALRHALIPLTRHIRRGRGGLRLHPHLARSSTGGEACALHQGCTLDRCSRRPPNPSLLAIGVPHHVGCGRRRRCVSIVSGVSDLCFKCFI